MKINKDGGYEPINIYFSSLNTYNLGPGDIVPAMRAAGDGLNLYLKMLKWIGSIFFIMSFFSFPSMTICYSGEAQEKDIPADERW